MRLYVSGETPGAIRARDNSTRLIDAAADALVIDVVDIELDPQAAEKAGVLATPTLSDESVHPPRRLIGDFSDLTPTLEYFGLTPRVSSE